MTQDIVIQLHEDGAPPERLAALTSNLRVELLQLDVDDVRASRSSEIVPPGARAGDAALLSDLVVTVASSTALLTSVASVVTAWISRGGSRKATLTIGDSSISLEGVPAEEQQRLVRAFLRSVEGD